MEEDHGKLLLVGCGNLGSVLLKAWLSNETFGQIVVVQPSLSACGSFENHSHISFVKDSDGIPGDFKPDVVVVAAKPQQLSPLLPSYSRYGDTAIFVSLATGISVSYLQEKLGSKARIVRVMPNVAVQVGQSLNLAYSGPALERSGKDLIEKIFDPTGELIWLKEEELIDKLTPISGSGPAYFFLLTEILADSISKYGIEKEVALKIANQVLVGSALLLAQDPEAEKLRGSVTSKGGVTEAAIKILKSELPELVDKALGAALERLEELKQ